jgi:serine/threonine-protein phosphatase 2A regulatory subunit B''
LLLNNKHSFDRDQTWDGIHISSYEPVNTTTSPGEVPPLRKCIKEQVFDIFDELGKKTQNEASLYLTMDNFIKITKEVCSFPSFFNGPLYKRILYLWNTQFVKSEAQRLIIWNELQKDETPIGVKEFEGEKDELFDHLDLLVNKEIFKWYWTQEMENYDASDRFFRLIKKPFDDHIGKEDFMPYLKELLRDHPGLEFLSNHAEFQEKYALTVITRIFYTVNRCHSGRITARQVRRSDLVSAFRQVDEEEDINKVTRYFSYEHFYVLYCRFWELDHDRDYKITKEDLMKYGDQCLSHMIVDRIFEAAPRPFGLPQLDEIQEGSSSKGSKKPKDYLTYEDFIFFMLSEEDKANEISVRYWFTCIDVDGDGKLNNMEMRSFYALQQHRMQQMGGEQIPFEDMLCQMIDMIKPKNENFIVVEDFLQEECVAVSGALFDALFNLNKYMQFESRDPFQERQKREDEFETDWDRFACMDYNRLAMEEEAREDQDAMEIDWVTVDDEDEDNEDFNLGLGGASEAPF